MVKFRCLIADDEPIARQIVQNYCSLLPALEVVASCENALEAKAVLENQSIDILFLDINMPVLDGIAFLKTIKNKPQVILTTAYKEYALNAFDLSAVDYLLKPFSLERFIVAVDKAIERVNAYLQNVHIKPETREEEYLFLKIDSKIYRISFKDIVYAEASGNYTKLVTVQHSLLPAMTFSNLEQQLPKTHFIRVHRSFIINKSFITHIEGNRILMGKVEIPIGSNYKEAFLKELGV